MLGTIKLSDHSPKSGHLDLFAPKPIIEHLFRKPDKRPLEALSFLFAAIAALPLFGLVLSLYNYNVNLKVRQPHSEVCLSLSIYHSEH